MNNEIIMSDSVSEEHHDELDGSADDVVTSTFSFTFKTYLFGGTTQAKTRARTEISTYLSTFVSSYVYEFKDDDEVRRYISSDPHAKLSTTLTAEVTALLSTEISTDLSDGYDDGIPQIRRLDFGFYAVPKKEDIDQYIMSVDNELIAKHEHYTQPAYLSSEAYELVYEEVVMPDGSVQKLPKELRTSGDYYAPVDNWCTLAPYVDRIIWRIDEVSQMPFPYNVRPYPDPAPGPLSSV
jgi:hypothetical protein